MRRTFPPPVLEDHFASEPRTPEAWEHGWKDTVIAYRGEVTRIAATFDREGLHVWHCHILSREDNEMMRNYLVLPEIQVQ